MKLVYLFIYIVIESEAFEVLHRLNEISEKWYLLCDIFLMGNLSVLKSHDSIAMVISSFVISFLCILPMVEFFHDDISLFPIVINIWWYLFMDRVTVRLFIEENYLHDLLSHLNVPVKNGTCLLLFTILTQFTFFHDKNMPVMFSQMPTCSSF